MDWSLGRYEETAAGLLAAAETVLGAAAQEPGERVLDIGCGTGNAALLAAERGARVTGIDPAERLLEVARADASARGLDVEFIRAEAEALPLASRFADLVVSVFGVIFATAAPAVAEMTRVLAPNGRIVFSAWIPAGALSELMQLRRAALAAHEAPQAPPSFAWHDERALRQLFGSHGFDVELREHAIPFTAASAEEFLDAELRNHPMWVTARNQIGSPDKLEDLRHRALALLERANEDPRRFRITSRYIVVTAHPQ